MKKNRFNKKVYQSKMANQMNTNNKQMKKKRKKTDTTDNNNVFCLIK